MKQLLISLTTLIFSLSTFAGDDMIGDWCMKYDDFTKAMRISKDSEGVLNVRESTIGNESREAHGDYEGYISQGVGQYGQYMKSRLHRNAEMSFWGYFDHKITYAWAGKKILIMNDHDTGH
ncbi:MAG: hypothetical protein HRT44_08040, partial [Bdellovibrionales bacterium]|nr:hypothetical protein [Bdellovibrionales bacterium]NQZ19189.1 hypothetical protein [Bdellovibrionales bacterium]